MPSSGPPATPGEVAAIIFDFDGVIADTERLHLGAFQDVFLERGWTLDEGAYFERYLGCDDQGLVVAYAADHGLALDPETVRALVEAKTRAFGRHLSSADILFAGAKGAIEMMARRFPLAIASGALHHEISAILHAGGLTAFFPVIVGAEDVSTCKPSPEPYLTAAARLGIDPSACVAIEDSVAGLEAAKSAGMRTIAVTTTLPAHALAPADRIIAGLHELSLDLVAEVGAARAL